MSRTERIVKNVSSNWAGYAINAVITLILTPYVLQELGIERYGIWILITSLVGYYGVLDLGFRAGVNQFLIRSIAADDFPRASTVISSAFAALSVVGVVVVGLTIIAAYIVPSYFELLADERREIVLCILIVGTAAAMQLAFSPFASVFVAAQRFDLSNLIGVTMRLLSAAGVVVALKLGFGLVGVAAATATTTVLGYIIRWVVALRVVPELELSRHKINFAELREIGTFGLWSFLISMADYAYLHLLPLLVAAFMPVAAVGHYALAAGLWFQLNGLFSPIGQVLYPAAAELHLKRELQTLERVYCDGTRLLLLVVLPVVLVASFWADDFYRLWIGDEYIAGDAFVSVATLLKIMLVGTVFGYSANIAAQILIATGHVREIAILKISGALTTISLSSFLIRDLGLVAIPISLVIAITLVDVLGVPFVLRKAVHMHFSKFLGSALPRLAAVVLILCISFVAIKMVWIPRSWPGLIVQGFLSGICIVGIVLTVGVTQRERKEFVVEPIRRLFGVGSWAARDNQEHGEI